MDNYGIRPDYRARAEALTVSEDPTRYWNRERIANSDYYQYDVYRRAAEHLRASERRRFVDVGCGYPKKVRELIAPLTDDVTLMDHPSMQGIVERDFPGMRFVGVDLEGGEPAVAGRRFDCVVSADVIEHLFDPDALLERLCGLLEPGGRLFLSTPEREISRGRDCLSSPKPEHVREWSSSELRRYLESRSLAVVEHHLLPKGKLGRFEELLLPLLRRALPERYRSCQLAVCTLTSDAG